MLSPRIVEFEGVRLAALDGKTSLAMDVTASLWQQFSVITRKFPGSFAAERYSVSAYGPGFFTNFDPQRSFRKWAAAPVTQGKLPTSMLQWLDIPPGLYAVFQYRGKASDGADFFRSIFTDWLPQSGYQLDLRPHFEILPPGYAPDDPSAVEDVYIPVICD